MTSNTIDTTPGIARAAMLATLNISMYSGRKMDRNTQAEITAAKGAASANAASVYKNLFSDCAELEAVTKFAGNVRNWHYRMTLPWSDSGLRLLPTKAFMDYTQDMNRHKQQFEFLVDAFLNKYDTLVAAAAFKLGTLFDRDEYPQRNQVERRFKFELAFTPLPTSGDFRLDIESDVQQELVAQYERRLQQQIAAAQQDAWTRMYEALTRVKDRLTLNEDGTRRVFHDTMITGAQELCDLLTQLNVTKDPALEKARQQLEDAMNGVDVKELRKEEGARLITLQKVNAILDAFDWGVDEQE